MPDHSHRHADDGANGPLTTSRRDFLRTTAAAGALATGVGSATLGAAQSSGIPTPRLHVDGNLVKDPDGNTVKLRGINMADPKRIDVTAPARGKTAAQTVDFLTSADEGWYPRIVRVPAQPVDIGEHVPGGDAGPPTPPAFTQSQLDEYLEEYYDPIVERLKQRGVYVIVDFHRHWTGGDTEWSGEWDTMQEELSEEVTMFWDTVAQRYAEEDHVLFEVYNEPTQPGMWGDPQETGGVAETWEEWHSLAQPWVNTIREHADNIVIIGSPSWTQSPEGYYVQPFEGENLAYSYHIYAGHNASGDQAWDDASVNGEGVDSVYEDVPLFVTEFGWEQNNVSVSQLQGQTSGFGEAFFEWLEQSESIHYTAWCADPVWRPVMFTRPWTEDDPSQPVDVDSIGHPYDDEVRVDCPDLPCEWELLGGENYAGEYVKDQLYQHRDDDLPGVAYEEQAPPTPTGLTVEDTAYTEIDLSWNGVTDDGGSGLSHYTVHLDGEPYTSVYEGTSTTVEGLTAESDYQIELTAEDRAGNVSDAAAVEASTDSFEDDTPPTPPADLEAVEVGQNSVDLAWEPGEPGGDAWITGYRVYVDGEPEDEVGESTTETTVAGLQFETTYELGVATTDAAGNESDLVTVTATPTSPEDQEPYEGPHTIPGEVPAMHHDTGGEGVGFETDNGGGGGERSDGAGMEQSDGPYDYHLAYITAGDWWEYTVEVEGPGTYEVEVGAAQPDQEYFGNVVVDVYVNGERVATVNENATGGWQEFEALSGGEVELPAGTNIVRLQAGDDDFNLSWWALRGEPDEVEPPATPENLSATADSATAVDLTWSAVDDAASYNVYLDGDEVGSTSSTSYTFDDLDSETTYDVGVEAENVEGTSDLAELSVTTPPVGEGPCDDLETIEVDGDTVCNVDGDDYFRDVNGDGSVGNRDVGAFFENFHLEAYDRDEFDYSGNGRVSHGDVVSLFDYVI